MRKGVVFACLLLGACGTAPKPLASVPLRPDGRLFLIEARINDAAPAWFMVDSGTSHTIVDPRLQRVTGLTLTGVGSTRGEGSGSVAIERTEPLRLRIGDFQTRIPEAWVIDLSGVPIDKETRGLVGTEIFLSHIVRIDPVQKRFEIFDPKRFRHNSSGAFLPLIVENDQLYIDVTLDVRPGLTVTEKVRISTAAEESVNHPIVEQALVRRQTEQGNGLGSNFMAWSGQMQAVHIGPYVIKDVWGPGSPTPSIGMEMLRRFVVTFDAPHRRIHLMPTPALADPVPPPS